MFRKASSRPLGAVFALWYNLWMIVEFPKMDKINIAYVIGSLALIALGYFGYKYWHEYQLREDLAIKTMLLEKQILEARDAERDQEILSLRQELEALKNAPKEEPKTVSVPAPDTTASLVKEWSARIAEIECTWTYTNGTPYARGSGSATIAYHKDSIKAFTSKHVLLFENQYGPRQCKLILPGNKEYTVVNNFENNYFVGTEEDWGFIKLASDKTLNTITQKDIKVCKNVEIGDKVLVLGYPGIGSQTGLTVTEGIVSGFDGSYYITSAKIDKGNSGGAAILAKDNCYLGIPSASVVGVIESLGRILKASIVLEE